VLLARARVNSLWSCTTPTVSVFVSQPAFRERVHRSSRPVKRGIEKRERGSWTRDPSSRNATTLIKIDDDEIAQGQFDECRYPLNYRSRIARYDDQRWEYRIFTDAPCGVILFKAFAARLTEKRILLATFFKLSNPIVNSITRTTLD